VELWKEGAMRMLPQDVHLEHFNKKKKSKPAKKQLPQSVSVASPTSATGTPDAAVVLKRRRTISEEKEESDVDPPSKQLHISPANTNSSEKKATNSRPAKSNTSKKSVDSNEQTPKVYKCRYSTGCTDVPYWVSSTNERLPFSCHNHKQPDQTLDFYQTKGLPRPLGAIDNLLAVRR
jgi:hypothetical protein